MLFLTGYRATGKTTVGKALASHIGAEWLDTDLELQKVEGRSSGEIIQQSGEPAFRQIEREFIANLIDECLSRNQGGGAETRPVTTVISLGGGAILDSGTRELIRPWRCVWLHAPAKVLAERITATQSKTPRPALTDLDLLDEVRSLIQKRQPIYSDCADYNIDTSQFTVDQTVEQIAQWLSEVDKTKVDKTEVDKTEVDKD